MTRRDMTFHGLVALGLVFGIVGGNFVLHRWMFGNVTSREANAGTASQANDDEVPIFIPKRTSPATHTNQPTIGHRNQLRKLIEKQLPNCTSDEIDAWLEQLQDLPLQAADEILSLRQNHGPLEIVPLSDKSLEPVIPPGSAGQFSR